MDRQGESKSDYARWSLYLGAASIVGAGFYWLWQIDTAEQEKRYRAKYQEAKKAIQQVQQAYGLLPTGKLDEQTRELFFRLSAQGDGSDHASV